jgi:hypothetical protein
MAKEKKKGEKENDVVENGSSLQHGEWRSWRRIIRGSSHHHTQKSMCINCIDFRCRRPPLPAASDAVSGGRRWKLCANSSHTSHRFSLLLPEEDGLVATYYSICIYLVCSSMQRPTMLQPTFLSSNISFLLLCKSLLPTTAETGQPWAAVFADHSLHSSSAVVAAAAKCNVLNCSK